MALVERFTDGSTAEIPSDVDLPTRFRARCDDLKRLERELLELAHEARDQPELLELRRRARAMSAEITWARRVADPAERGAADAERGLEQLESRARTKAVQELARGGTFRPARPPEDAELLREQCRVAAEGVLPSDQRLEPLAGESQAQFDDRVRHLLRQVFTWVMDAMVNDPEYDELLARLDPEAKHRMRSVGELVDDAVETRLRGGRQSNRRGDQRSAFFGDEDIARAAATAIERCAGGETRRAKALFDYVTKREEREHSRTE